MQFSLSFAMLLLCNLVVSQICNEREAECYAPRQCATCYSRRYGSPQTVCSTPSIRLQSRNSQDYCDGSYSMCTCADKVYRPPIPSYEQMLEVTPSTNKPGFVPNKTYKEHKELPGIVPVEEQFGAPYKEKAPFIDNLKGTPSNNPSFIPHMEQDRQKTPSLPSHPFTVDDKSVAFNVLDQEVPQEMGQEISQVDQEDLGNADV